ncbi:hypothetical protein NA78x_003817 [Anatilimnocola sp. NA78]|uniref:hypothetical protein n=1 Tax=Anatilimnocola sp. NA78 TaxID=3415683 RepID=UPI003CE4A811
MTEQNLNAILQELTELRSRVAQLEAEAVESEAPASREWSRGFYLTYYATAGFFLGMIAALVSLAFNVVGSVLFGAPDQHPLQLIKVYLTFGLGERALEPLPDGLILIIGCCLYIATGMFLGIPFQIILTRFANGGGLAKRLAIATVVALAIWLINFYLILSWLQPSLFGGNWIVNPEHLPISVAVLTHLVFGWTMALVYPLGKFEPYQARTK